MRKLSSILFLGLLLLNVAGFTLLTFWGNWESENSIAIHPQIEINGDSLIYKYALSLPYSGDFQHDLEEAQTALFNGTFYQALKVTYRNDTILTYYIKANYTRENVLTFAKDFSDSQMLDFSEEKENSSSKSLEFFKKISKDYHAYHAILSNWFWIDYTTQKHFYIALVYKNLKINRLYSPPDLKVT